MSNVKQLIVDGKSFREPPKKIIRPCDYSLLGAVTALEEQVGTVEAYNKICIAATNLKNKIDSGNARQANILFATNPDYIYTKY